MTRSGFSLLEVIVAMTVFSLGVLGVVAAAEAGERQLRDADLREERADALAMVLDSLLAHPAPADGERDVKRHRVRWTVSGDRVRITASLPSGPQRRAVTIEVVHVGGVRRVGGPLP